MVPRSFRRYLANRATNPIKHRRRAYLSVEQLEVREVLSTYTPGNLVILQAGDGGTDTTTGNFYLNEITTSGTSVQQFAIPNNQAVGGSGNQPITLDLSAAAGNGQLNRSYDGSVLTFGGVDSGINSPIDGANKAPVATDSADRVEAVTGSDLATITAASWSSGTVTITANNDYASGETISVSGIAVSGSTNNGYNGTFTLTAANSTSFQYAVSSNPGTASGGGLAGNVLDTTTHGQFYVGDDNRGSVAESATGPLYAVGHPNQAGGAVEQGVHLFSTEGPSVGTQVSASTNIRGATIGFDNRAYFSTATIAAPVNAGGIFTEAQALPTAANANPSADVEIVPSLFTKSKLGGVWLADMNGTGILSNGDRLYFLDDGTVGGTGTGGLYVATWNDNNTSYAWDTPNNSAAAAAGIVDHWGLPVRLGDAPVQTGDVSGQLRGIAGTVISSTEADIYTTAFDDAAGNTSYVQKWVDTNTGVAISSASESGSTVTITTATANAFTTGETVEIDGVGAATGSGALTTGFNGAYTITRVDSTHFTYTGTSTGLATVTGQGAADVTVTPSTVTTLSDGTVTNAIGSYAAQGLRGIAFSPVAPTTVTLTVDGGSSDTVTPGTTVTFAATLTNSQVGASGLANTTVTFIDQNTDTVIGQGTVNSSGVASFTTSALVGDHIVTAYFAGGSSKALPSARSGAVTLNEAGTTTSTTSLSSNLSAVALGKQVTLTATVTSGATGNVSFYLGSVSLANLLGTSNVNGSNQATLNTSFSTTGALTLIAVYNGDGTFASSQGQTTVSVAANATATITSSANNVALSSTQTYQVTINGNPTLGTPGGTVVFNIVSATNNGTNGAPSVSATSSAITLTAGANNTATALWTGPALSVAGSYFIDVTYTPASGSPYSTFATSTLNNANGVALIETVQQAFAPGDLVAVQRGDGNTNLGSDAYQVFLVEYTPTGSLVQKIALPNQNAGSTHALFTSGQSAEEGLLNRSANGYYLTLAGYDTPLGHSFITSTFPYQFPRTIALVNGAANVDTSTAIGVVSGTGVAATISGATESGTTVTVTTSSAHGFKVGQLIVISGITTTGYNGVYNITGVTSTTFTYTAASGLTTPAVLGSTPLATPGSMPYNPTDVVSNDGKEFWLVSGLNVGNTSESAIEYVGRVGASTATEIGPIPSDANGIAIAGGQLYVTPTTGDNVSAVGSGLPTTAGQTLSGLPNLQTEYDNVFGTSHQARQVLLLNTSDGTSNNPNLAYVADSANGLLKFWKDGSGNWHLGQLNTNTFGEKFVFSGGAWGVVGYINNPGTSTASVQLYVTGSNVQGANPNQIASFTDTNGAPAGTTTTGVDQGFASGSFSTTVFVGQTGASGSTSPNGNENFAGLAFVPGYVTSTTLSDTGPGASNTFTAKLTTVSGHVPTGVVIFSVDGSVVGQSTLSSGVATFTDSSFPTTGSHVITAAYQGDVQDGTSSGTLTQGASTITAGDLIATVVGTGSTLTSSGTATFVNEYAASGGSAVQSIALPTSGTGAFTEGGTQTGQGYVTDSADGHTATLGGYNVAAGSSTSGTNGDIAVVNPNGSIESSTQISSSNDGGSVKATVSADGLGMWVATGNFVQYVPFGNNALTPSTTVTNWLSSPTTVAIGSTNPADSGAGDAGQLFFDGGAGGQSNGIANIDGPVQVGAFSGTGIEANVGLPNVGGQSGTIVGATTFPTARDTSGNFPTSNQIVISPDGNTIFVADGRTDTNGGILEFFQATQGSWTELGHAQVDSTADGGLLGLTASYNSSGAITALYATTTNASANRIVKITGFTVDGTTPTFSFTTVETAAAGTAFRGVALAPTAPGSTSSTTSVTVSGSPGAYPGAVAVTATVSGTGGTPTGYVSFRSGGVEIGAAALSGGVAVLTPGSNFQVAYSGTVTAVYTGDATFASSSGTGSATVNKGTTSTALTAQFNPVATGTPDTLMATVTYSGNPPLAQPSGTVTFWDGAVGTGTNLGTATLTETLVDVSGNPTIEYLAGVTTTFTSTGSHSLSAVYSGDGNFGTSTGTDSVSVVNPTTVTVTTSNTNPTASPAATFTMTATVTSPDTTDTISGSVQFYDDLLPIGSAQTISGTSGVQATISVSTALLQAANTLTPGLHSISAIYTPDTNGSAHFFTGTGVYEQAVQAQTFGAGDVFVYRVGDGTTNLIAQSPNPIAGSGSIGSTIYVDEYTAGGTLVQSIILPSADSQAFAISSATESGSTVTITTASPHNFASGDTVTIAGVAEPRYDGTFTITNVTSTTFTYTNGTAGLLNSSGGTATGVVHAVVGNGQQSSTGQVSLSGDGQYLFVAGYDNNPLPAGTALPVPTASGSGAVPRSIARIKYDGTVQDVAMSAKNSGSSFGNFNAVFSPDGNQYYVAGNGGVVYYSAFTPSANLQSPSATMSSPSGTTTALEDMGGNLAVVGPSGTFGNDGPQAYSGFPTSAASISNLSGFSDTNATNGGQASTFYIDAYFTHLNGTGAPSGINTFYLSDDGPSFSKGAITKWALVSGTWQVVDHITADGSTVPSFYYLAGQTDSSGNVTLYVTYGNGGNSDAGPGDLFSISDTGGWDAAIPSHTVTKVASTTSTSNEVFRGVALAPLPLVKSVVVNGATTATITNASESTNTVTITTSAPHAFFVGEPVTISGIATAGYNGTWYVATVPTSTTFTYTDTTSGLATDTGGGSAANALSGAQRSMVDTVVYTFNRAVNLGSSAFNLGVDGTSAIAVASESGSTVTITTSAAETFAAGQVVTVAGVGVAGYNGPWTIVSVTDSTHFTYTDTTTGLASVGAGGTVGVGTLPGVSYVSPDGGFTWVVTFTGTTVTGNSIADGVYNILLNASAITVVNTGTGVAQTNRSTDTFYRLFGDSTGAKTVGNTANRAFSHAFNSSAGSAAFVAAFDFSGGGSIGNTANRAFARRFNVTLSGFTPTI